MSTPPLYGQVPEAPRPGVPQPPVPQAPPVVPPAPAQAFAPAPAQPRPQPQPQPQPQPAHPGAYGQPQPSPQQQQQQPYGAPAPVASRAKKSGKATTIVVTALVTATVSVLATLLATGTLTAAPLFEREALESGVSDILSDDFELTDVKSVSCPAEAVAERGEKFECTFTSGGEDLSVPVEVLNDDGQYRVGGPLSEDEKDETTTEPTEES